MGKQAKLMILMFVCSACDMTRVYYPLRVINAESEYVFIDVCTRDLANGSAKCNPLNVPNIDLYKNAKTGITTVPLDYINVYQDRNRKCYLYSYSREDLLNKKCESGFNATEKNIFLIVDRTGVSVEKKYIDSNSNSSANFKEDLCKPKPINE